MSTFETLRQVVENKFNTTWTKTPINTVDFGSNRRFTPPTNKEWVRLITTILFTENAQIGKDFQRSTGIITVQCFAPENSGEKFLNEMIDSVSAIFENATFSKVNCFATTMINVGTKNGWYQINADTNFNYDVFS